MLKTVDFLPQKCSPPVREYYLADYVSEQLESDSLQRFFSYDKALFYLKMRLFQL
jgi:hypothetical protein